MRSLCVNCEFLISAICAFNLCELEIISFILDVYILKFELYGIFLIVFLSILGNVYAIENKFNLEYELFPTVIHTNDMVTLELFYSINGQTSLEKIENLKVESLDPSIIDVVDINYNHEYKTQLHLKAMNEGETTLYVIGEGSQSLEIPIKVYGNTLPKNISLDIFPDNFELGKNNQGILTLLLTDENGIVTKADKDYLIKLSSSKSGIVSFDDPSVIISKGDFDTSQIFTVNKDGLVTITAKTDDFESSELITVDESLIRDISISVIPEDISSSKTSSGNLVAQLFSGGKLVEATEDITVFFDIKSSNSDTVNTSSDANTLNPTGYFQIKKGQSYGHEFFSIQKGETDSYVITANIQDPLTIVEDTFTTLDVELYGDGEIKFEPISVLADGSRQLVGILYLEDTNGHPVTADRDIVVPFTTADNSISIETSVIKKGYESSLVFGNMGYFVPSDTNIAPNILNSEVVSLDVDGFAEDSVSLKTHIPTDHFIKGEQHWITVYMESSDGLFEIPKEQKIEISESDVFFVDEDNIKKYQYFTLIPIIAIDSGDEDVTFSVGNHETTVSLSSMSTQPDSLNMEYSDKLFNGVKDTFLIQILNSKGLPLINHEDVEIKIFSSDPSILAFPKNVTIPEKSGFISLDVIPISPGTAEISLVSEGLPILTDEILIEEITPTIQITSVDMVDEGDSFLVSIIAKQNGSPLRDAPVHWDLEGGITTISDEYTGPTGEAIASILSTSDESVKILATIDGPIQSAFASKIVQVNATTIEVLNESDDSFKKPEMAGVDPILFIVPALIVGMVLYMKKKSK